MGNTENIFRVFKYTKPFLNPMKGRNGHFGYGYYNKRSRGYFWCGPQKRQYLRDLRRYGFDTSDNFSLYRTIMLWLSDNIGGMFRQCGDSTDWEDNTLDGTPWCYTLKGNEDLAEKCIEAGEARKEFYKELLDEFLTSGNNKQIEAFRGFVIPRLRYFSQEINWTLNENGDDVVAMVAAFEKGEYKLFIDNIFSLYR